MAGYRITNWLIDHRGQLRGELVGEPKEVRTTHAVARMGNVVTTKSGSQYELVNPPHLCMTIPEIRLRNHPNTTSVLDVIDQMILKRREPKSCRKQ